MRAIFKAITFTGLIIAAFAAGAFAAGLRHRFEPIAYVEIRNESGQDISNLVLTHQTRGVTSRVELLPLANGKSADVHFFIAGEGGYQVEATLSDGRVIKGGAGYVEAGYSITEVVKTSSIASQTEIGGL